MNVISEVIFLMIQYSTARSVNVGSGVVDFSMSYVLYKTGNGYGSWDRNRISVFASMGLFSDKALLFVGFEFVSDLTSLISCWIFGLNRLQALVR